MLKNDHKRILNKHGYSKISFGKISPDKETEMTSGKELTHSEPDRCQHGVTFDTQHLAPGNSIMAF